MARGRLLPSLLVLLAFVSAVAPTVSAAPLDLPSVATLPPGTARVELAAAGSEGAMLAAAAGANSVSLFEIPPDGALPAKPLASFAIRALAEGGPLSGPQMAVLSSSEVGLFVWQGAALGLAVLDPYAGEIRTEFTVSAAGESAWFPSILAHENGFLVSYLATGSGARQLVVEVVDPSAGVTARSTLAAGDSYGGTLVAAMPSPYLAVLRPTSVEFFVVSGDGSLAAKGSVSITATAGSVWARAGMIAGLFSISSGLVHVEAPESDLALARSASVSSSGAGATGVVAAQSAEGRLLAAAVTAAPRGSSTILLREEAVDQFSTLVLSGARPASAAVDAFGLARLITVSSTSSSSSLLGLVAGDADAVAVTIEGPESSLSSSIAKLTIRIKAVRSDVTVVGLDLVAPSGWSATLGPAPGTLSKGATATVSAEVRVPAGTPAGLYPIEAAPAVLEASARFAANFALKVASAPAVSAGPTSGTVDLAPGGTTSVALSVENRGASAAVVDLTPSSSGAFLVTPATSTVTVASGSAVTVRFDVAASASALPLDGAISVMVRPRDGSAPSTVEVPARVQGVFRPSLALLAGQVSGAPGETLALPFQLSNAGNVAGYVSLSASVSGLLPTSLVLPAEPLYLPAFRSQPAPVELRVPTTALEGTPFEITLTMAPAQDIEVPGFPVAETLLGTVERVVSVSASYLPGPSVPPGGEASGRFVLANDGNTRVSFDLAIAPPEPGFTLSVVNALTGGISVAPFTSVELELRFRTPSLAAPGTHTFVVSVASAVEAPIAVDIPVVVEPAHGISLALNTPTITITDPVQTQFEVRFDVSNAGNTPDELALGFSIPASALSILSDSGAATLVDPGAILRIREHTTHRFRAFFPVGPYSADERHVISLTVEAALGGAASASIEVQRLRADPRVASLSVGGSGKVGELHVVRALAANDGPAASLPLRALLSVNGVVVATQDMGSLPPRTTRLVLFDFVPRSATTTLDVTLTSADPAADRDPSNNAASAEFEVVLPVATPIIPKGSEAPAAAASISLLLLIGVALTEVGKHSLISALFLPLYVKLRKEEVLDQYLRGQIHGYIIANPGEHYNAIKDQLAVTNGALAYHLHVLEREGYIRSQRDGMYKRFYPVGVKIPKRRRLSSFQDAIVKTVRDNPDISQKRIAEILGVSNQVVNYHVKQLEAASVLKIDRSSRASKLTLGPEAPPLEGAQAPSTSAPSPAGEP